MIYQVASTFVRSLLESSTDEKSRHDEVYGAIFGTRNNVVQGENIISIWGALCDIAQCDVVLPCLPGGIEPLGILIHSTDTRECAQQGYDATTVWRKKYTDADLILVVQLERRQLQLYTTCQDKLVPVSLNIVDSFHAFDYIPSTQSVLVRSIMCITVPITSNEALVAYLRQLRATNDLLFRFPDQPEQLWNMSNTLDVPLSSCITLPSTKTNESKTQQKKKKKQAILDSWSAPNTTKRITNTTSNDIGTRSYLHTLEYGPIANIEILQTLPNTRQDDHQTFCLDALVVVDIHSTVQMVLSVLYQHLNHQLCLVEDYITQSKINYKNISNVTFQHFTLNGATISLTIPFLNDIPINPTLVDPHLWFQTYFNTRISLVDQHKMIQNNTVLLNVHEGITSSTSRIQGGIQSLVNGFYGYYHYMQQNINDKGWGCAYRSLQTLASWVLLNHHTSLQTIHVPTHSEIQQTLIMMGDKEPCFLHSREWIGSIEVGYVLNQLYGITCRNLYLSNNMELIQHASTLEHHFQTHGSPIMMGGGQLAFTIIGIDYNSHTGDCAFLILDPHYTGVDTLEMIQTKTMSFEGYKAIPCGWRQAKSFKTNCFYNLCLPQRPELT